MSEISSQSEEECTSNVPEFFFIPAKTLKKSEILIQKRKKRCFYPLGIYYVEIREKNM